MESYKNIELESPYDSRRNVGEALDEIVNISLKHKYLYTQISKSGSSAVKSILQKIEFQGLVKPPKIQVNNRFYSPHVRPFQLGEHKSQEIFKSNEFVKFTFVRNPYSRILSCYLHRMMKGSGPNPTKQSVEKFTGKSMSSWEPSFSDFVHVIGDMRLDQMEAHFLPQYNASLSGLINYSFFGKLESFDQDMLSLLSELNLSRHVKPKTLQGAQSNSPEITNASNKLPKYLSKPVERKILEIYRDDFDFFDYSHDPLNKNSGKTSHSVIA